MIVIRHSFGDEVLVRDLDHLPGLEEDGEIVLG